MAKELRRTKTNMETEKMSSDSKAWGFTYDPSTHPESIWRFCLVPDEVGVTYLNDLTMKDAGRVQRMARDEFSPIEKKYNMAGNRKEKQSTTKTVDESAVFEIPLNTLLERDRKIARDCESPLILQMLILYLKHNGGSIQLEGIFEDIGAVQRTRNLVNKLNRCFYAESPEATDRALNNASGTEIVGVLKHFISRLPDPLLTHKFLKTFSQLDSIDDPVEQMKAAKLLNLQLPTAHRASLMNLFNLFSDVISSDRSTHQGLDSVAEAMAPFLFPLKEQDELEVAKHRFLTKTMLLNRNVMNAVPPFMMQQIRKNRNPKARGSSALTVTKISPPAMASVDPMLATMGKGNEKLEGNDMLIDWPGRKIRNFRMKFNHITTACDVILQVDAKCIKEEPSSTSKTKDGSSSGPATGPKFLSKLIATSYNELCTMNPSKFPAFAIHLHGLFETGGNIESRRLRPKVRMMSVFAKNPEVKRWVIKCQHPI